MSNPQGTPGASAPGLPGATIIETQPAPAPTSAPAHVSDVSGMSESQVAAMRFVDANRAAIARDPAGYETLKLRTQTREALAHAIHGEPAPAWLAQTTPEQAAAAAEAGARPVDPDSVPEFGKLYQPMNETEAAQVRTAAVIYGVPPAEAKTLAQFCMDAKIPATQADGIAKRVAHHLAEGGSAPLSPEERAEFYQEAARSFGSEEKFLAVNAKARAYIESLPPAVVQLVDEKLANTSIVYDPRVLIALAALADARGVKAK